MSKERRGDSETGEGHRERPAAGAAERARGSLAAVEGRWWGMGIPTNACMGYFFLIHVPRGDKFSSGSPSPLKL